MIQAYPFKSAEILDLIFKTKLKGFPCNFVLIFFKKLKGLQVTGDPFNFKTPLHKNPCKTPLNPFKHLQCGQLRRRQQKHVSPFRNKLIN